MKKRGNSNKILALMIVFTILASMMIPTFSAIGAQNILSQTNNALDIIHFGDSDSEKAHAFEERLSVAGVDNKAEPEYVDANGKLAGGGLGHGLTYRYIQPSPEGKSLDGKLEFTLKADPNRQNYLTVRLSGTQQGRGNLMLYGPDGDNTILNPKNGWKFSELDIGYDSGAPFSGRYYYATYIIPQGLVKPDGTVRLTIMSTGKFDPYGKGVYKPQTENSKYIYSAATHTDPFYIPEDSLTGEAPVGKPAAAKEEISPYGYLQSQAKDLLELVMSWQLYGPEFEAYKNKDNEFLEGAVVTYEPVSSHANFKGTRDEWARKVTANAINKQNWSPMAGTTIFANAFMYEWSDEYYHNKELLDRIIKLYDFFARAQDSQGAWCVVEKGEDAWRWIGADLNGSGQRGKGENWPLLTLGTDELVQTFIQLNNHILNSDDRELKDLFIKYLDEKVDNDMTGKATVTRRASYIEMFAKLRDYLADPVKGDFYDPKTRAGTANQDFGFAYDANRAVELLFDSMELSSANKPSDIPEQYQVKDNEPYLRQLKYKFGEMVDGEKWFSENGVGLEGGASHGGWAGEYGLLLLKIINKYAETAESSEDLEDFFGKISYDAYEAAQYFLKPSVTADGENILISEMFAGSRNTSNGQKIAYPVAGYTALKLGSKAALRMAIKYIEDNHAYAETFKQEVEEKTPHVYTRIIELQELLKYYKEIERKKEELEQNGEMPYLPMEDEHPDFAWADLDSQAVVFKNNGDKVYVTFNYRRDNWKYNQYARIRFTNDTVERLANVVAVNKGGTYTFQDSTTHPDGKTYTHNRFDGYSQVRYGKYFIGMNQSRDDASVGQTGKVYYMDTLGIKKAKDLMTGKVYESVNGGDIKVQVQPRQTVILEVLEESPVYEVSVKYVAGEKILGFENIPAILGQDLSVFAKDFEGYKLTDEKEKVVTVSSDNSKNTVEFSYSDNAAPVFNLQGINGEEKPWEVINVEQATGKVEFDKEGNPISIASTGVESDKVFSTTFAYKEVTGDVEIKARLDHFTRTASDSDYFSIILTDSLDLKTANYVQLRHFTNNNNILLISHKEDQKDAFTGYWAGDMNNKKVPIYFKLVKSGDNIRYYFSLDEEKTYEQTSKPAIHFDMSGKLYVGVAMTSATGIKNIATISDVRIISDDMVLAPKPVGEEVKVDLGVKDPDGDIIQYDVIGFPEGATIDEATKEITWKPVKNGTYTIKAQAYDDYHAAPVEKMKEVIIGKTIKEEGLAPIKEIKDMKVTEGETVTIEPSAQGASIKVEGNYPEAAKYENGKFTWNTKKGDAGTYNVLITYEYENYIITKIVKITVNKLIEDIDYSVDRDVSLINLDSQQAVVGREFVYKAETAVPVDGFGANVSFSNLPKGATFENRTLKWTPTESDKNTSHTVTVIATQPNGKTTTGSLIIHVVPLIKIELNEKELKTDTVPVEVSGRVLVPVRVIAENLGATVAWDANTNTAMITKGEKVIKLQLDNQTATLNGESILLDVPATLINNRTMVPIRFVSESLGAIVDWEEATETVKIKLMP
ncbi:stalk domain-containing protein [Butyricicoccus intestinisimiae]|jgi:hypothetical protein|uniref:stalk domain-containing protein n=1 Tax=Butyricicoccus intestinisimiae TaxID=2841509 RepID=UPI003D8B6595